MKFSLAWAKAEAQNNVLKVVALLLTGTVVVLAIALAGSANKAPLVVERGCVSRAATTTSSQHNESEVRAFLEEALAQRFDTKASESALLSERERAVRFKELTELKNRAMTQRVLVNDVRIDGARVEIDADRLISVGAIRTALPISLVGSLGSVARSRENPYGLILVTVALKSKDQEGAKNALSR